LIQRQIYLSRTKVEDKAGVRMLIFEDIGDRWVLVKDWSMAMNPSLSYAKHFARWVNLLDDYSYSLGEEDRYDFGKARTFHSKLERAIKQEFNDDIQREVNDW
jgi:hypothetical protein